MLSIARLSDQGWFPESCFFSRSSIAAFQSSIFPNRMALSMPRFSKSIPSTLRRSRSLAKMPSTYLIFVGAWLIRSLNSSRDHRRPSRREVVPDAPLIVLQSFSQTVLPSTAAPGPTRPSPPRR